ncbi:dCTP deaminase domain-containing protein [Nostoc sp. MS1]|uniref:dCTP deaminase domain-containing protein n=1 Tax=Nostoc sp. MS1 TaxID=2764711 RepID=UPI001CC496B8|nr:hypothetical protein [Nostoc sp. MS1]BCL37717.1 hypothetical protein NSMS1_41640 [Nostoc sp. MS1]
MSVLSDRDIIDELVRGNLLFYPFNKERLKGSVLGLTASKCAYSIKNKSLLKIETDVDSNRSYFEIDERDTVLIFTNECIALNDFYCGTIHSKVLIVSRGLSHIGTKVNPGWSGILSIPIHNLSTDKNKVYVNEVIAYLRFHKLSSRSLSIVAEHKSGRLNDFPDNVPQPLNEWIHDSKNTWRTGDTSILKKTLEESQEYQEVKRNRLQETTSYRMKTILNRWAAPIVVSLLMLFYFHRNNKVNNELIIAIIPVAYTAVSEFTRNSRNN